LNVPFFLQLILGRITVAFRFDIGGFENEG
jgi:hypothetical protein